MAAKEEGRKVKTDGRTASSVYGILAEKLFSELTPYSGLYASNAKKFAKSVEGHVRS